MGINPDEVLRVHSAFINNQYFWQGYVILQKYAPWG